MFKNIYDVEKWIIMVGLLKEFQNLCLRKQTSNWFRKKLICENTCIHSINEGKKVINRACIFFIGPWLWYNLNLLKMKKIVISSNIYCTIFWKLIITSGKERGWWFLIFFLSFCEKSSENLDPRVVFFLHQLI